MSEPGDDRQLRVWLRDIASMAIDWLDELDAGSEDREDDEREIVCEDDARPAGGRAR